MEKYTVFIDLDGTLLLDWHTPNNKDVEFILNNKDKFNFVINTGRPTRFTLPFYELLKLDTPVSCYNGSLCFNPTSDDFITRDSRLDHVEFKEVIELFTDKLICAYAEINDTLYLHKEAGEYSELFSQSKEIIPNLLETLNEGSNSAIIIAKDDYIDEIIEHIEKNTNLSSRSWGHNYKNIIEFFQDDINKGETTKYIMDQLNLDLERTICFGDELNDIQMIDTVKYGVVMGNAKQDRLGQYAKIQTVSNVDGGISTYLTDFLNNDVEKYNK